MSVNSRDKRTVLVAVDSSDNALVAFEWFLNEVFRKEDFVVVCHVPEVQTLPLISLRSLSLPVEEWQSLMKEHLSKVNELLEKYEFELVNKKIAHKMRSENHNNPGQGVIEAAEAENARLIVIGTRGLDSLRRTVLGSVSDYVVHHSKIPVLVCPKNE